MAYTIVENQPPPRSDALEWDARGPGLYPGEALVRSGDHLLAVSVDMEWIEGFGAAFHGCARWVDADGQTHICPQGKHVEVNYTHTADTGSIEKHGVPAFKREVLLLLLGEDPQHYIDDVDEVGEPTRLPLVWLNDHDRSLVNAPNTIKCVKEVSASADALNLL